MTTFEYMHGRFFIRARCFSYAVCSRRTKREPYRFQIRNPKLRIQYVMGIDLYALLANLQNDQHTAGSREGRKWSRIPLVV